MRVDLWRAVCVVAGIGIPCVVVAQVHVHPAAPPGVVYLFQRIEASTQRGVAITISASLSPSAWRVGHGDGPRASAAQLAAMLENLRGALVAEPCLGDPLGPPRCSTKLPAPSLAGIASTQTADSVLGWVATDPASEARERWLGLLRPEQYGAPDSAPFGARLVLRFDASTSVTPAGHSRHATPNAERRLVLVAHNDPRGRLAKMPDIDEGGRQRDLQVQTGQFHRALAEDGTRAYPELKRDPP
jgi:hypothetical protein